MATTTIANASPTDLAMVESLRARLQRRREVLAILRKRITAARSGAVARGRPLSSVGDISRRFMNAAAESEDRVRTHRSSYGDGNDVPKAGNVSSLLSKWNQGFQMKEAQREKVDIRGNVTGAKSTFSKPDTSLDKDLQNAAMNARRKASREGSRGELVVEDEDVPAWAVNQSKRVIRKENPRDSTGSVDLDRTKGSIFENGKNDVDTSAFRERDIRRGDVSNVIAMWGQKADDQAARERTEQLRLETMRSLRDQVKNRSKPVVPEQKYAPPAPPPVIEDDAITEIDEESSDDDDEPTDIRDLITYLQARCERVDQKIESAEDELHKFDRLSQ